MNRLLSRLLGRRQVEKTPKKERWIIEMPELNAIYIAIPKVACSSVKRAIATSLDIKIPTNGKTVQIHQADFCWMDKQSMITKQAYFKFGFVRNPWDRLVSCYSDKIRSDKSFSNNYYEQGIHKGFRKYGMFEANMPFKYFLEAVTMIPDDEADQHFRSQCTFLSDQDGKLVTSYIGRFERLEEDFNYVFSRLGKPNVKLPHSNKSRDGNDGYREYFTDDLLSMFEKRYAKDIELFGYVF